MANLTKNNALIGCDDMLYYRAFYVFMVDCFFNLEEAFLNLIKKVCLYKWIVY